MSTTSSHPVEVAHDEALLDLLYALAVADQKLAQAENWLIGAVTEYRQRSYTSMQWFDTSSEVGPSTSVEFSAIPDGAFYFAKVRAGRGYADVTLVRDIANADHWGDRPATAAEAARVATVAVSDALAGEQGYYEARRTERLQKLLSGVDSAAAVVSEARKAVADHEVNYTGWQRFWLVVSSAGHVHSSTQCSSCFPTTRFAPVPALSASTEAEAIETIGETLCTVCFPNAPVHGKVSKVSKAQAKRLTGRNWEVK